jgi:hypothetical protein
MFFKKCGYQKKDDVNLPVKGEDPNPKELTSIEEAGLDALYELYRKWVAEENAKAQKIRDEYASKLKTFRLEIRTNSGKQFSLTIKERMDYSFYDNYRSGEVYFSQRVKYVLGPHFAGFLRCKNLNVDDVIKKQQKSYPDEIIISSHCYTVTVDYQLANLLSQKFISTDYGININTEQIEWYKIEEVTEDTK